ncbi:hypothetical protein [Cyclobacterium salsum]|uniref:hypothetical protein n=1 Tax=Cyclobacterium salsum TaxID=2666329 RepID=UPI001F23884B|nr:hypothetical protein [Cyclobacterium salsum]
MHRILFPFLFVVLLFSCDSGKKDEGGNKKSEGSNTAVYFEKLDSIKIDYLGSPTVHDLDPINRTVLFMEHKEFTEQILLADFEGNIQASFTKSGDVPDSYGALMASLKIDGDSSFMAYSYNGFLTYDFNGELQSRVKLKEFRVPNFTRKAMGYGMEKWEGKYLYIDQGSRDINYSSIDAYNEIRLLNWLDPETGEKEPFIQFPESSIFKSGKYFFRDSWAPAFTLVDNRIYVAFGIEPIIYIYEAYPPYSLISSFPLDLPNYEYFKGEVDYGPGFELKGFNYGSGRILNIKKIDKHFAVAYFKGYEKKDRDESSINKSPEEARAFNERMREKYPIHIAVLDSNGNRLNDFVPKGLRASSMLIRNHELWMVEEPDRETERDYFRLFRVGLKMERSNQKTMLKLSLHATT